MRLNEPLLGSYHLIENVISISMYHEGRMGRSFWGVLMPYSIWINTHKTSHPFEANLHWKRKFIHKTCLLFCSLMVLLILTYTTQYTDAKSVKSRCEICALFTGNFFLRATTQQVIIYRYDTIPHQYNVVFFHHRYNTLYGSLGHSDAFGNPSSPHWS